MTKIFEERRCSVPEGSRTVARSSHRLRLLDPRSDLSRVDPTQPRLETSLAERLAVVLAPIHALATNGLGVGISQSVDEAFASFAREFRC